MGVPCVGTLCLCAMTAPTRCFSTPTCSPWRVKQQNNNEDSRSQALPARLQRGPTKDKADEGACRSHLPRSIDGAGDASPLEVSMFCVELDAVMLELPQEEPEVVHTGSIAAMEVGDDVGLREGVVDSLASIAKDLAGDENAAPVSDSALDKEDPAGTSETQSVGRKTKYPRVVARAFRRVVPLHNAMA